MRQESDRKGEAEGERLQPGDPLTAAPLKHDQDPVLDLDLGSSRAPEPVQEGVWVTGNRQKLQDVGSSGETQINSLLKATWWL